MGRRMSCIQVGCTRLCVHTRRPLPPLLFSQSPPLLCPRKGPKEQKRAFCPGDPTDFLSLSTVVFLFLPFLVLSSLSSSTPTLFLACHQLCAFQLSRPLSLHLSTAARSRALPSFHNPSTPSPPLTLSLTRTPLQH